MELITLILFAIALNLDSIAVGTAYGVRGIKLPLPSLLIISGMSAGAVALSMAAGGLVANYLSPGTAHRLGGIILFLIGLWILYHSVSETRKKSDIREEDYPKTIMQIRIKNMGIVINVLREPHQADLDRSGEISSGEAILLGAALAVDALGAGFAVSMLGFSIVSTALVVGLGHIITTCAGMYIGRRAGATALCRQIVSLPGCILIALGLYKIY